MSLNKEIVKHLLFWAALGVMFVAEFFYRKPLYQKSLEIIIEIQKHANMGGRFVFEGISFIGAGALYFVMFLIVFNWGSRPHAYYYLLFISSCLFFMVRINYLISSYRT